MGCDSMAATAGARRPLSGGSARMAVDPRRPFNGGSAQAAAESRRSFPVSAISGLFLPQERQEPGKIRRDQAASVPVPNPADLTGAGTAASAEATASLRARLSCVIQAGGSSTRMGFDKATAPFRGRTLIEGVLERLAEAGSELVVTTGRAGDLAYLGAARFGEMPVRVEPDLPGPSGAMRGVASSLAAARRPLVCIVACDMPFISPELILGLAARVEAEGLDVCVPRTRFGLEPLCAVWRRDACLEAAKELLNSGRERIRLLLDEVRTGYMGEDEIIALTGGLDCFANINTPEDLAAVEG